MAVWLIVGANYELLDNRVRILYASRHHFGVDTALGNELKRLRVCIGRVDEHVRDSVSKAKLVEKVCDIKHEQRELFVTVDHYRSLANIFEVNEPVCISIEASCLLW